MFDKTGTLGDGRWALDSTQPVAPLSDDEALALAGALERPVRHPLASAFEHVPATRIATDIATLPGKGITGRIDGEVLRIGIGPWAADEADDGAIWLGDGQRALARFELRELPRAEARETVDALRSAGLSAHLLSGDDTAAVARFARHLDLPDAAWRGRLLPEEKLAAVRQLQKAGKVVAMVGDGINDAPVLAGADVSIAVAGGASMAQQAADLVLTHESLLRIPQALQLARRTMRIIRQNLALSLGYNVLALPLAAMGHVKPWIAALAMVTSSLTVTLNALRLARDAKP